MNEYIIENNGMFHNSLCSSLIPFSTYDYVYITQKLSISIMIHGNNIDFWVCNKRLENLEQSVENVTLVYQHPDYMTYL